MAPAVRSLFVRPKLAFAEAAVLEGLFRIGPCPYAYSLEFKLRLAL